MPHTRNIARRKYDTFVKRRIETENARTARKRTDRKLVAGHGSARSFEAVTADKYVLYHKGCVQTRLCGKHEGRFQITDYGGLFLRTVLTVDGNIRSLASVILHIVRVHHKSTAILICRKGQSFYIVIAAVGKTAAGISCNRVNYSITFTDLQAANLDGHGRTVRMNELTNVRLPL